MPEVPRQIVNAGILLRLAAVVLCLWSTSLPAAPAQGKALYEKYCAFCHGVDGRAATAVGRALEPRPRNFADPVEMARLTEHQIYHAIKDGKPGTAMAAWGKVLNEPQIGDLMDYLRTLAPPAGSAASVSLEIGRRIYEKECAFCHGLDGRADTDAAKVLRPAPRNFADPVTMARVDDGRLYAAIKLGKPGTAMASWGELLSPAEIIHVMRYVRTLERPLPAGMSRAGLDVLVGEQIYRQHCLACHGEQGNGRTTLGQALTPPPRDFTGKEMARLRDAELAEAIAAGRAGTAMGPWSGVLNPEDIRRVVQFIRQTFQRAQR